ncbi:MAG: hypothetical protein U0228_30940 [Myxococcaceae bacterium]
MRVTFPAVGAGFVTLMVGTALAMRVTFPAVGAGFVTLTGAKCGAGAPLSSLSG